MGNARKATAAVAAVLQYIKTEEEAIAIQSATLAAQPQLTMAAPPPAAAVKPWGGERPTDANAAASFDAT